MDKFPEAFARFEEDVDTEEIEDFRELKASFSLWAGEHWVGSSRQISALKVEAHRLGISVPVVAKPKRIAKGRARRGKVEARTWRFEKVTVKGKSQPRYRDLETGRFIKKPE